MIPSAGGENSHEESSQEVSCGNRRVEKGGKLFSIFRLVELQSDCVDRWHRERIELDGNDDSWMRLGMANHEINFRLWHEEDLARDPEARDETIAAIKRRIDALNQRRSHSIEAIDDAIAIWLDQHLGGLPPDVTIPMNTETPGSTVDRLSILSLRIFHLAEQAHRHDIDATKRAEVTTSLETAKRQRSNLVTSAAQLIDDLVAGKKRHLSFRQLKMYNDPELNPMIYQRASRTNNPKS